MRSKLPAHFHSALEIRAPLKGAALYRSTLNLVGFYGLQFEMVFPPLNIPLLLFKYMKKLCLPGLFPELGWVIITNYEQLKHTPRFVA